MHTDTTPIVPSRRRSPRRRWVGPSATLALLSTALVAAAAPTATDLVASSAERSWRIDPAAATATATPILDGAAAGRSRGVERNGSRAFFHVAPQGADGKAGWWIVVHPPIHARGRVVRLPIGFETPSDLSWDADGRGLVFVQTHDGTRGAWRVPLEEPAVAADVTGTDVTRTLLSPPDASVRMAAVAETGSVSWARLARRDGKAQYMDLDVRTPDGTVRTVLHDSLLSALAWSPSGDRLGVGLQDELRVIDPATGATLWTRALRSLDDGLYAHHPRSIAWRPDGNALAVVIHFSGGRSAGFGDAMPVLLGDREVFVLPLAPPDAKATVVTAPDEVERVTWTAIPAAPKAAPAATPRGEADATGP